MTQSMRWWLAYVAAGLPRRPVSGGNYAALNRLVRGGYIEAWNQWYLLLPRGSDYALDYLTTLMDEHRRMHKPSRHVGKQARQQAREQRA